MSGSKYPLTNCTTVFVSTAAGEDWGERAGWGQNLWALDQPVVSCQLTEYDKNLCLSVFCEATRRPQMPGWLEASLKLGLRRPQLSTDRSHGLLATNRVAEKNFEVSIQLYKKRWEISILGGCQRTGIIVSQKAQNWTTWFFKSSIH